MSNNEFERQYGFRYKTDWSSITSENYDHVFIVFTLYDALDKPEYQSHIAHSMLQKIYSLIRSQSFKHIALFDTYDYPYDPNIYPGQPVNTYFKRNYSNRITYQSNVVPFPLSMFCKPCVMWKTLDYIDNAKSSSDNRIMNAVWIGGLYKHIDSTNTYIRDRTIIHSQIKNHIVSYNYLPYDEYIKTFKQYAICIDLCGVGDPNKRTFEIFASGALWMSNIQDLNWGFEKEDRFSDLCIFTDGDDFIKKKMILLGDREIYFAALEQQNRLVYKYFNKDALRKYIVKNLIV